MVDSSLFSQEEEKMEIHQPYSQSILGNDFMFQQTLHVHQGSVRCLATLDSGYMMSGSIDKTTKLFMLNNATGKYDFEKELNYHNDFVYSLCHSMDGNGFYSGGKDKKIFKVNLLGDPLMMYEGHESVVNSLSQSVPEELVSGSWDGTARIWDVETGQVKNVLSGHSYAVAVLSLANGIIITGSQDKKIRLWYKGNMEKEFEAHGDIIRDFVEVPGLGFASCSNDETVKLWTIDGTNIAEMKGHKGFVFSLTCLDSGEIISASDDCTVRVWRDGQCAQTINHPRTVWSVTKNHLGDIITGCEDYKIRTFTRDFSRKEEGEQYMEYEQEVKAASLGHNIDLNTLPDISLMSTQKGKKDGEIRVFRNGDSGEAYVWKDDTQTWEKIGDVITQGGEGAAQEGITAATKYYEGDKFFEAGEYDHIFDVDLGDGYNRKLPFDNGGNPYDAGEKFLAREQLGRAYTEQVVQFLKANALRYATSDAAQKKQQTLLQKQYGNIKQKQGILPIKKMVFFDQINVDGPKKKLLEFNQELQYLNQHELTILDGVLELVKNKQFYHSSKLSKQGFELVKKLLKMPSEKAFPALDIYRMLLMHPNSSENFKVFEVGQEHLQILIGHLRDHSNGQPTQLMALRCLVNLFQNAASLYVILSKRQYIIDNISNYLMSENKNIRNAAITMILNYSIAFFDKKDPEGRIQCISAISEVFNIEKDANNYLRLVAALGNLGHDDQQAKELIGAMGINIDISGLEGGDEKTMNTIKDIVKEIK